MKARIIDGVIVDIARGPDGSAVDPAVVFGADLAEAFADLPADAPAGIGPQWRLNADGTWTPPPELPAPPPAVPRSVSNYQARTALIHAGKFDAVDAGVRAAKDPLTIQAWDYANDFYRDSPFIQAMAGALAMSDADIDALFIAAAAVKS